MVRGLCLVLCVLLATVIAQPVVPSPALQFTGSRLGTTLYNLEPSVIALAKQDLKEAAPMSGRKDLLCVTFLKPNATVNEIFFRNVEIMDTACDWAAVFYDGKNADVKDTCANSRIAKRLIHCQRSEATKVERLMSTGNGSFVQLSVPKTVLYQELLPHVSKYKRVFLMDEDISLEGFNITTFSLHWSCALQPPPLIVQPVIAESNQYIKYVNQNSWSKGDRSKMVASGVGLVEQQVPLFDAVFFEWFVRRVLSLTRDTALSHGVDWGHDRSWCNAARMYSREVLHHPDTSTACAVLPRATAVHHLDLRSMQTKRDHRDSFHRSGLEVVQRYIDFFPTWVEVNCMGTNNPLDFRNFDRYKRVYALNAQCVARHRGQNVTSSRSKKSRRSAHRHNSNSTTTITTSNSRNSTANNSSSADNVGHILSNSGTSRTSNLRKGSRKPSAGNSTEPHMHTGKQNSTLPASMGAGNSNTNTTLSSQDKHGVARSSKRSKRDKLWNSKLPATVDEWEQQEQKLQGQGQGQGRSKRKGKGG